jgi:non-ribosomal peptide synthase protein (TIGR01720 family)
MTGLRERVLARIASLTPDERSALAARLGAPGHLSLVAYVVTSGAASADELRRHLDAQLPDHMVPASIVLVDAIPRTAAGKIDRQALTRLAENVASDEALSELVPPRTATERQLASIWCDVLGLDAVSVHDDFFALGGDSLLSIRVLSRAGRHGLRIDPEQFFANPTIAAMAAAVAPDESRAPVTEAHAAATGQAGLTPIQHWFFDRVRTDRHHWNQSYLLSVPSGVTAAIVSDLVTALLAHHDGLRTRFEADDQLVRQVIDPVPPAATCRVVDVSHLRPEARAERITAECQAEQQRGRIEEARLARFVFFDCGPDDTGRLLIVVHHLLIDAYSWGILLEDVSALLAQALAGNPLSLPPKTAAVIEWARALEEVARQSPIDEEVRPWLDARAVPAFPAERAGAGDTCGDAVAVRMALGREHTAALVDRGIEGCTALEILLAAWMLAWRDETGHTALRIDCEGHGRDVLPGGPDVSRTVGWFTTVFPVMLEAGTGVPETLRRVAAAYRALGRKGASHGIARYLGPPQLQEELAAMEPPPVLFNYLGRAGDVLPGSGMLALAPEDRGDERSPGGERTYPIEINSSIQGGCLQVELSYNPRLHSSVMIGSLARRFVARLQEMAGQIGPSSPAFDLSGLDAAGLARAAMLLDDEEG